MERSVDVAAHAAFDLRHAAPDLPDYPVPDGHTEMSWLRELTRQGAALRAGADPVHAFVDGYHLGLLVTILLLAGGVVVSYVTLRPRAAASAEPMAVAPARESAAVGDLTTVDELAGELMVADEVAR